MESKTVVIKVSKKTYEALKALAIENKRAVSREAEHILESKLKANVSK